MEILDRPIHGEADSTVSYFGDGAAYFGIWIVNAILTIVTFGFYYPWARAANLRYLTQEAELDGSRFQFHGTGREMFIGFLKAIGIFLLLYIVFFAALSAGGIFILFGFLFFFGGFMALIPIAIHGSMRYRLSRTSWRGIHMGYHGDLKELFKIYLIGGFLTLITFGIYGFWLVCQVRRYVISHARLGNVEFSWKGSGSQYFGIFILGYFLTFITLFIYSFWWMRDLYKFHINNLSATQNGRPITFRSVATPGAVFRLMVGNFFLVILTLGLGIPWATMRTMRFIFNNIELDGKLDADSLEQSEEDYRDATGDDLSDMLDIGIV